MSEQSRFLQFCIEHEIIVTIFVEDGMSFMGIIRAFDKATLLLGYRNPTKLPKMIMTRFITFIRADSILELRKEFHSTGTAESRRRAKKAKANRDKNPRPGSGKIEQRTAQPVSGFNTRPPA